jgi:hypothetical protein
MFHESDGDTSSEDEGDERLEEPNLQPVALWLGLGIEIGALFVNSLELLIEIKSIRPLMYTDHIHVAFYEC